VVWNASDITRYRSTFGFSSTHLTITLSLQTTFPYRWMERLLATGFGGHPFLRVARRRPTKTMHASSRHQIGYYLTLAALLGR
jgi:hypothetical protein